MAANYAGEKAIKKLTELVLGELGKKQDKLSEITAEEVQQMWNDENSALKDSTESEPEPEPEDEEEEEHKDSDSEG